MGFLVGSPSGHSPTGKLVWNLPFRSVVTVTPSPRHGLAGASQNVAPHSRSWSEVLAGNPFPFRLLAVPTITLCGWALTLGLPLLAWATAPPITAKLTAESAADRRILLVSSIPEPLDSMTVPSPRLLSFRRHTGRVTSEKSTTPDLVALARRSIEVESIDGAVGFYAPDGVWDASPWGMGVFEGQTAIRGFFADWLSSYSGIDWTAEEIRDLGNGVTFAVILQKASVVGSTAPTQLRYAAVMEWSGALILHTTTYTDIDEARVAAERLARERE